MVLQAESSSMTQFRIVCTATQQRDRGEWETLKSSYVIQARGWFFWHTLTVVARRSYRNQLVARTFHTLVDAKAHVEMLQRTEVAADPRQGETRDLKYILIEPEPRSSNA
jgi:hypothetical protein